MLHFLSKVNAASTAVKKLVLTLWLQDLQEVLQFTVFQIIRQIPGRETVFQF